MNSPSKSIVSILLLFSMCSSNSTGGTKVITLVDTESTTTTTATEELTWSDVELVLAQCLRDNGYEVFKNCGCSGPIDLIVRDSKGNIKLIDVKTAQPQLHKETGNNVTKGGSRSPEQVEIGVQLLQFEPDTRTLRFVEHRE